MKGSCGSLTFQGLYRVTSFYNAYNRVHISITEIIIP